MNMLKSHSIRLAVNLCLIGAMLLSYGGIAPAIASACQTSASTTAKCAGCGHCDVEHEGGRCGCCSKKNHNPAKEEKKAPQKGCCHNSNATDKESNESEESDSQGVSACLCGQGSQPAVPAPQTRIDLEQVLKLAPKLFSSLLSLDDNKSSRTIVSRSQPLFLLPHASQRLLCIWLI